MKYLLILLFIPYLSFAQLKVTDRVEVGKIEFSLIHMRDSSKVINLMYADKRYSATKIYKSIALRDKKEYNQFMSDLEEVSLYEEADDLIIKGNDYYLTNSRGKIYLADKYNGAYTQLTKRNIAYILEHLKTYQRLYLEPAN